MIPWIQNLPSPSFGIALLCFVGIFFGLAVLDNTIHEPPDQPTAHVVLWAVDFYRAEISGVIIPQGACRFIPTCSDYMQMAVLKHGSIKGAAKGLWRICRCSPFTDQHGCDYP